ncbi:MAG: CBS domain-containing protein [Firmicutes bacterium]|nr:CBS domain-containing protein [Bacillota bacterium]
MQLSQRFIMAYNKIDRQLQKRAGIEGYMGFSQLVRRVARKDTMIAQFEDDLLEYAELRNAIVHELVEPARVIAEPHASVVEHIEQIAKILEQPPLIIPRFQGEVTVVKDCDPILHVMDLIREHGYTQFPVYDETGRFKGLLTDRCLARWLTFEFEKLVTGAEHTSVAEVMQYDKAQGANVAFLSPHATVFDAYREFERHMTQDYHRLEAILITPKGRKDEPLLGIITPWDMFHVELP